jgi:hypothetical protein
MNSENRLGKIARAGALAGTVFFAAACGNGGQATETQKPTALPTGTEKPTPTLMATPTASSEATPKPTIKPTAKPEITPSPTPEASLVPVSFLFETEYNSSVTANQVKAAEDALYSAHDDITTLIPKDVMQNYLTQCVEQVAEPTLQVLSCADLAKINLNLFNKKHYPEALEAAKIDYNLGYKIFLKLGGKNRDSYNNNFYN